MKKIILLILVIIILLFSGCIQNNENQNPEDDQNIEEPLYIVMDTGINDDTPYIDIQNIDTQNIRCHVSFTFTYLDDDSVGQGYDMGGSSAETGPSGLYTESHTAYKDITPHYTTRISRYIPTYSCYSFLKWNYTISASFID